MKTIVAIALMILACVFIRLSRGNNTSWRQGFKRPYTLLGVALLLILPLLILVNPELLALGFLGDAAFVDLLALLIGLQFKMVTTQIRSCVTVVFASVRRCLATPRLVYIAVLFSIAIENIFIEFREIVHRIST